MEALKKSVAMLDPSSPLGQAVLRALKDIGKEVGNVPADAQQNSLQSQLLAARRNAMQRLALQQMQMRPQQAQNPMVAAMMGQGGAANANQQPAAQAA